MRLTRAKRFGLRILPQISQSTHCRELSDVSGACFDVEVTSQPAVAWLGAGRLTHHLRPKSVNRGVPVGPAWVQPIGVVGGRPQMRQTSLCRVLSDTLGAGLSTELLRSLPGSEGIWDSIPGVSSLRSSTTRLIADTPPGWTSATEM